LNSWTDHSKTDTEFGQNEQHGEWNLYWASGAIVEQNAFVVGSLWILGSGATECAKSGWYVIIALR